MSLLDKRDLYPRFSQNIAAKQLIPKDTKYIIVGLSGGVDSVCLLDLIYRYKLNINKSLADRNDSADVCAAAANSYADFEIIVHHQNHLIRTDANEDLNLAAKTAAKYGLEFHYSVDDVPQLAKLNSRNLEDMGRIVRHNNWSKLSNDLFQREVTAEKNIKNQSGLELTNAATAGLEQSEMNNAIGGINSPAEKSECKRECDPAAAASLAGRILVATAHHANDQAETVLLNLSRGTGLSGLTGIKEKNAAYIRPLLIFTKEELYAYARFRNLEWREDYTNHQLITRRNYLRLDLLPSWAEHTDAGLVTRIASTSEKLAKIDAYLNSIFAKQITCLQIYPNSAFYPKTLNYYSVEEFINTDSRLQEQFLTYILKTEGLTQDVFTVHLQAILAVIYANNGEKVLNLPHGFSFVKNRRFFYLKDNELNWSAFLPCQNLLINECITEQPQIYFSDEFEAESICSKDQNNLKAALINKKTVKLKNSTWELRYIPKAEIHHFKLNEIFFFSTEKLAANVPAELEIRTAKPHDYYLISKNEGENINTHKYLLKDYFAQNLVPLAIRDKLLNLCAGSEVYSCGTSLLENEPGKFFHLEEEELDTYLKSDNINAYIWYNLTNES